MAHRYFYLFEDEIKPNFHNIWKEEFKFHNNSSYCIETLDQINERYIICLEKEVYFNYLSERMMSKFLNESIPIDEQMNKKRFVYKYIDEY